MEGCAFNNKNNNNNNLLYISPFCFKICREEDEVSEFMLPLEFSAVQLTAFYTRIPESTVYRITAREASLIKEKPGPHKRTLDDFDMCVL